AHRRRAAQGTDRPRAQLRARDRARRGAGPGVRHDQGVAVTAVMAAEAAARATSAGFPLLTALILVPAAGAVVTLLVPGRRPELTRVVGLVASAATFGLAVYLLVQFDTGRSGYQFVSDHSWMPALGIRWILGVDGISLFMVALTTLLIPISLIASADLEKPK